MSVQFLVEHQEEIFRRILWITLIAYTVAGITVGVIKVSPPKPPDVTQLPARIAKLIIKPKPIVPPPNRK